MFDSLIVYRQKALIDLLCNAMEHNREYPAYFFWGILHLPQGKRSTKTAINYNARVTQNTTGINNLLKSDLAVLIFSLFFSDNPKSRHKDDWIGGSLKALMHKP
jgi:hypothetical protein